MNRRLRTIALGAIPLVLLSALVTVDHIPGTDITLTVPFAAEGPGPTFNTLGEVDGQEVIDIEGAEVEKTSGNLNMTTVAVRSNMTLADVLGRWILTDDTIVPIDQVIPPNLTDQEVKEQNTQAFSNSEASATIAALDYLDIPVGIKVASFSENAPAAQSLKVDDIITAIDGNGKTSLEQISQTISKKSPGDVVAITVERAGKPLDVEVKLGENPNNKKQGFLGIMMVAEPPEGMKIKFNLEDVGGPSAGLMFTLAIIDKLSPGELTDGKFIAGTGTIDSAGEVGEIGGISHKIQAAKDAGAEVFLAPEGNCGETTKVADGITVISVSSVDQAIEQLDLYNQGKRDQITTCAR